MDAREPVAAMLSVLKLFLIPVGGGIPSGVLLARANGLAWPITALLYLLSDIVLAVAFEPFLRLLALLGRRVAFLARFAATLRGVTARNVARFSGTGAGPVSLVMIAFGVDPMTGRAAALAGGYGFLAGWAFAISGDLLYFGVIALTTLQLSSYFGDPATAEALVLALMFLAPMLLRYLRSLRAGRSPASLEAP